MLLLSLALGLTFCFFAPAEIYLGSQSDFLLSAKDILIPLLLTALAAAAGCFLLLCLLLLISETAAHILLFLLGGLLLTGYIQMLLLNGSMAEMTGGRQPYTDKPVMQICNLLFDYALFMLPVIAFAFLRTKKRNPAPALKLLAAGAGVILLMQLAGFLSLTARFGLSRKSRSEYNAYLSFAPAGVLSEQQNITVFLTDRLDGLWMDDALAADPTLADALSGFTFYQNNVSCFTNTFPSVTQMLTGAPYRNESSSVYFSQAWSGDTLPDVLHRNGWAVNLLLSNTSAYHRTEQIADCCDNLVYPEKGVKLRYFGKQSILSTMLSLSYRKTAPYMLKNFIRMSGSEGIGNGFLTAPDNQPDRSPDVHSPESDLLYLDYLRSHPLTAAAQQPVFSYIHLNFAHDISGSISALSPETADCGDAQTAVTCGAFRIVREYLEQLRAAGLYDRTTVIILGDHGRDPAELDIERSPELASPITTALLIKPADAAEAPLRIDAETPMSNAYFGASVREAAGLPHSGFSYGDILRDRPDLPRWIETQRVGGGNSYDESSLFYEIIGNARDEQSWHLRTEHPDRMPPDA